MIFAEKEKGGKKYTAFKDEESGEVVIVEDEEELVRCKDEPLVCQKEFNPKFKEIFSEEVKEEKPKRTRRKKDGD